MMPTRPATIRYAAVNHCIYCGTTESELNEEHVIPFALNGEHVLPKSSCIECRDIIQKVEDACLRLMFRPYRSLVGFSTRRPAGREKPFLLDIKRQDGNPEHIYVPLEEHPAALLLLALPPPLVLPQGDPPTEPEWGPRIYGDFNRIGALLPRYKSGMSLGRIYIDEYCRMLAKIAHGLTYILVRNDPVFSSLEFLLPGIILGKDADIFQYAGGKSDAIPGLSDHLSLIENHWKVIGDHCYLIWSIRLFCYLDNSPIYTIVTARFAHQGRAIIETFDQE